MNQLNKRKRFRLSIICYKIMKFLAYRIVKKI